ncbi:MAG: TM0996/MTH895 family glutaredoxin-like protein [Candidatus Omnitrophica bacterium]|nr:TM0996/MTH895 family glutaredoxin-like protein [Candidatus Omnitrophota bacterium]
MKIEILGIGCPKCKQLAANVEAALKELNFQAEIGKVTDIDKITEYGVMMTPGIAVDGTAVSSGKVLSKDEIKKLISKCKATGGNVEKTNHNTSGGCCCC